MPPHLPLLWLLGPALSPAGAAANAAVEVTVTPLADTLVLGEPVFLRLEFRNTGTEPAEALAFWQWSREGDRQRLPPLSVERRVDGAWEEAPPDRWERSRMRYYFLEVFWPPLVRLYPGESYVMWWDARWSHDLGAGRFRFQFYLPVRGPRFWRGEEMLAVPAAELTIVEPTGRARELWDAPNTSRGPRGSWHWLTEPEPEAWAGTTYERWCWCYRAERLLCGGMPGLRFDPARFWRAAQAAMRALPADQRNELTERVEFAASLLIPAWEADIAVAEREVEVLRQQLYGRNDLEWADMVAEGLAERVLAARVRLTGGYPEGRTNALKEWRWPPRAANRAILLRPEAGE